MMKTPDPSSNVSIRTPSVSVSAIKAWFVCPRQYEFESVEHLPLELEPAARVFGIAIHDTLNFVSTWWLRGEPASPTEAAEHFRERWHAPFVTPRLYTPGTSFRSYAIQGEALVALYAERFAEVPVTASERPFRVPIAEHLALSGRFDLLRPGHRLVEFKTASKPPRDARRHRLQLAAYALAYRRLHGVRPRIELVTLVASPSPEIIVQTPRITVDDEALFTSTALEVERAIRLRVFPPNPGFACSSCPYTRACRATNEVHDAMTLDAKEVVAA